MNQSQSLASKPMAADDGAAALDLAGIDKEQSGQMEESSQGMVRDKVFLTKFQGRLRVLPGPPPGGRAGAMAGSPRREGEGP